MFQSVSVSSHPTSVHLQEEFGSIFPVSADQFNFICINTLLDIFLSDEGTNCPFIPVRYWEKQSHHFSSVSLVEPPGVLCASMLDPLGCLMYLTSAQVGSWD